MDPRSKKRIAILTQQAGNRSCQLLKARLEERGAEVDLIQYASKANGLDGKPVDQSESWYREEVERLGSVLRKGGRILDPSKYDGVMLRSWGTEEEGHAALRIFAHRNITAANELSDILNADSKAKTFVRFIRDGVPIPPTIVVDKQDDLDAAFEGFSSYPLVVKKDISSRGDGVHFLNTKEEALTHIRHMFKQGEKDVVLQEFIRTGPRQQTYRCVVVDGKLIGTMRLTAGEGELHTNTAKNGSSEFIAEPGPEIEGIAIKAAKSMGMMIAGVDIITDEAGHHYVLEANDGPTISTFVDKHHVPLDAAVADAFMEKIQARAIAPANHARR